MNYSSKHYTELRAKLIHLKDRRLVQKLFSYNKKKNEFYRFSNSFHYIYHNWKLFIYVIYIPYQNLKAKLRCICHEICLRNTLRHNVVYILVLDFLYLNACKGIEYSNDRLIRRVQIEDLMSTVECEAEKRSI